MQKHKKSLFMQDRPNNSSVPQTSHRLKFNRKLRKIVFQLAFKAIEMLPAFLRIIWYLREIFNK